MRANIGVPVSQQLFFCGVRKPKTLHPGFSKLEPNHRLSIVYRLVSMPARRMKWLLQDNPRTFQLQKPTLIIQKILFNLLQSYLSISFFTLSVFEFKILFTSRSKRLPDISISTTPKMPPDIYKNVCFK